LPQGRFSDTISVWNGRNLLRREHAMGTYLTKGMHATTHDYMERRITAASLDDERAQAAEANLRISRIIDMPSGEVLYDITKDAEHRHASGNVREHIEVDVVPSYNGLRIAGSILMSLSLVVTVISMVMVGASFVSDGAKLITMLSTLAGCMLCVCVGCLCDTVADIAVDARHTRLNTQQHNTK
jgi:hypothetical protein